MNIKILYFLMLIELKKPIYKQTFKHLERSKKICLHIKHPIN